MLEIKNELKTMCQTNNQGLIQSPNKIYQETNLLKLNKEILVTRNLRNNIISLFEKDVLNTIRNMDIEYLKKVPYPLLIDYKKLFNDNYLNLKIFTKKYSYTNYLFSNQDIKDDGEEIEKIYNEIKPYIDGIYRIMEESKILNNTFYDQLEVLLYNKYLKKMNISGEGISLSLDNINGLSNYQKHQLLIFYYDNIKKILKHIKVNEVEELNNYRSDINKQKILKIYRG